MKPLIYEIRVILKGSFGCVFPKVLMHFLYPQTWEPNYFPELVWVFKAALAYHEWSFCPNTSLKAVKL